MSDISITTEVPNPSLGGNRKTSAGSSDHPLRRLGRGIAGLIWSYTDAIGKTDTRSFRGIL